MSYDVLYRYRGRVLCLIGLHGNTCRGRRDHCRVVAGRLVVPPDSTVLRRLGW